MNAFVNAMNQNKVPEAFTDNGAVTNVTSGSACVDLFNAIGSPFKGNIVSLFKNAFYEDQDVAIRILLWSRDPRGGAGRKDNFRNIIKELEIFDPEIALRVMRRIPELGCWKDIIVFQHLRPKVIEMIATALGNRDALCAKWMPRKGDFAVELREALGLSPKAYRKLLVGLTQVVETNMCARKWGEINYSHVPSVASLRYRKAFSKRDGIRYAQWINDVKQGKNGAKVNTSVLFPSDVLVNARNGGDWQNIQMFWDKLPEYFDSSQNRTLVVCDVSGSMFGYGKSVSPIDVSIALGIYMGQRNAGPFKDKAITFSETANWIDFSRMNLEQAYRTIQNADWGFNTNLQSVFNLILNTAVKHGISQSDMPTSIVIVSDMEFDNCGKQTNLDTIKRKYRESGYEVPDITFWNVNGRKGNVSAKSRDAGVALVSGYSPSIMKSVICKTRFTPETVMLDTVMVDRYNW